MGEDIDSSAMEMSDLLAILKPGRSPRCNWDQVREALCWRLQCSVVFEEKSLRPATRSFMQQLSVGVGQ